MRQDIHAMRRKLCPEKFLGNFWKSSDYHIVKSLLETRGITPVEATTSPRKGTPARTMVHPLVALAFMRWADPMLFYRRIDKVVCGDADDNG